MKDKLTELYEGVVNEATSGMAVAGATNPGDLDGPTKELKGDGPDKAGVDSPEESSQFSSVKKNVASNQGKSGKKVSKVQKESKMQDKKSFMELYNEVVVEADIESDSYDDDMGDFPAPSDELGDEEAIEGEGEESKADLFSQLSEIYAKLAEMEGGMGDMEMDAGAEDMDMGMDAEGAMGEAVSEPEPKEFNPPVSKLQAPRKLAGPGVKTKKGKASGAIKGKRDGSLENAPSGTPVGGSNKVGGSGPAASGSGSMLES